MWSSSLIVLQMRLVSVPFIFGLMITPPTLSLEGTLLVHFIFYLYVDWRISVLHTSSVSVEWCSINQLNDTFKKLLKYRITDPLYVDIYDLRMYQMFCAGWQGYEISGI